MNLYCNDFFLSSSASSAGNVGVVHLVENASDIDWVIDIGPHPPYAILMWPEIFHRYLHQPFAILLQETSLFIF